MTSDDKRFHIGFSDEQQAWIEEWTRQILHLPAHAAVGEVQFVRAVELASAEADAREGLEAEQRVLAATADVLDRSFVAIADEFGTWPG